MKGRLTIQEIREQPDALARFMDTESRAVRAAGEALRRRPLRGVVLAARGSSDNAALYGHYLIETMLGLPVALASPSVVTIYRRTPRLNNMLVVGLSQSGRSPDIVEYLRAARRAGARTLAITNDPRSPLAAAAHHTVFLRVGPERSVAATKTYTAQLTALSLLVGWAASDRRLVEAHRRLPELIAAALDREEAVGRVARAARRMERCLVTSRGYNYATAREAALKLKETSYVAAEPLSSADLLHGPIAVVGPRFPVVVVGPPGRVRPHLLRIMRHLAARGARTIAATADREFAALATAVLPAPPVDDERLSPHVLIVPLQLFAYHLALARGFDPDRPRGVRKITRVL
ncbi:MAG TPA: SIS domain-containing protein [bacterium]|nr:SIS domain-containing protein [bacterium]